MSLITILIPRATPWVRRLTQAGLTARPAYLHNDGSLPDLPHPTPPLLLNTTGIEPVPLCRTLGSLDTLRHAPYSLRW